MLDDAPRHAFDASLEEVIAALPEDLHALLEEVPLIVEDEPSWSLAAGLRLDPRRVELLGLHWGVPLTRRSVDHGYRLPDQMMLFRGPIIRQVERTEGSLAGQIRITLLHEVGHHFGLDEQQLRRLGYG